MIHLNYSHTGFVQSPKALTKLGRVEWANLHDSSNCQMIFTFWELNTEQQPMQFLTETNERIKMSLPKFESDFGSLAA